MWFLACGRCLKARPRQIRGEITTECWCAFFKCIRIGGPVCDVLHKLTERLFCLVSYLAHLQRWYRGCRQRFRGLRATSLCIHLGEQKTAAGECGGSADSSTRGRGLGCLHPAPRCPLLLGCRLMSVSLLGGCFLPCPASSDCRWLVFLAAGCTVVISCGGSCCLHVDKCDGATARSNFFLLRSVSALCLPLASSGLVQPAFGFPPAALALGLLRCWCVCLIVRNQMPFHVSYGVVCGQCTVAAC